MKVCFACKRESDVSEFYARKRSSDGLTSSCKRCVDARVNKDAKAAWLKTEKGRALQRRVCRTANSRYSNLVSQAKRKGLGVSISTSDHAELISKPCHYCSDPLPQTGSGLDRKDSALGYTVANVVPCCSDCNTTKNNLYSYTEFVEIAQAIKTVKARRAA